MDSTLAPTSRGGAREVQVETHVRTCVETRVKLTSCNAWNKIERSCSHVILSLSTCAHTAWGWTSEPHKQTPAKAEEQVYGEGGEDDSDDNDDEEEEAPHRKKRKVAPSLRAPADLPLVGWCGLTPR